MIEVIIGDSSRQFTSRDSVDEAWINQQFQARRKASGQDPCVKIHVVGRDVDLRLASSACAGGGSGGRFPNAAEESVIGVWRDLKLSDAAISGGQVVAFVKRVFGQLR